MSFCLTPRDALASTATPRGSSRCAELQRCDMAYHLRYERGIAPTRKAAYFDVGSYVHGSLRWVNEGLLLHQARDWRDVIAAAREVRAERIDAGESLPVAWDELDPIDEAERLVGAYYALHGSDNGGWPEQVKLTHVELPLEDRSLNATACADLVVMLGDELIIPDIKTRARAFSENREEAVRDFQTNEEFLRLSALAQRHFGLAEPPPIWIDAIIKTKIPKVDRLLVRFTQQQIDTWRENTALLSSLTDIKQEFADERRRLPIRNYRECAPALGGRCWAFNWCHGTDEDRSRGFRVREEQANAK